MSCVLMCMFLRRTRTPDRRDRRSPDRGSERQRYDDELRGSRRRDRSPDKQPPAAPPPPASAARSDDGRSPEAADTADRTTAAVEAAVAGADAAAAAQEAADAGGAPHQAEATQPAANGHAPKSGSGDGAAPLSADMEPAKAGDDTEDRRSHRKYRKREGERMLWTCVESGLYHHLATVLLQI